jgi:hypothetical protein
MKIKISQPWTEDKILSLEQYLEWKLDGSDYERGALEEIAATGRNHIRAFSRLLEVLVKKGVITESDLVTIAGDAEDVKLTIE